MKHTVVVETVRRHRVVLGKQDIIELLRARDPSDAPDSDPDSEDDAVVSMAMTTDLGRASSHSDAIELTVAWVETRCEERTL